MRCLVAIALSLALTGAVEARRPAVRPAAEPVVQVSASVYAIEKKALVEVALDAGAGDLVARKHAAGYEIVNLAADSMASRLGLRAGDVITRIAGVALATPGAIVEANAAARKADWIEVELQRGGAETRLSYRVVEHAEPIARGLDADRRPERQGVTRAMAAGVHQTAPGVIEVHRAVFDALERYPTLIPTHALEPTATGVDVRSADGVINLFGLEIFDSLVSVAGVDVTRERFVYDGLRDGANRADFTIVARRHGAEVTVTIRPISGAFDDTPLTEALAVYAPPRSSRPATADRTDGDKLLDTIVKKNDYEYGVPRATVDALLANPMQVARGARIVPAIKNGKARGFKLYAIRPDSVYARLGFANGDTVHTINGMSLTTPDKALEIYAKMKSASKLTFSLDRRGKPIKLTIRITK